MTQPDLENLKPTLSQVVTMFGMQALVGCGKVINPVSKQYETDLPMAQYHIHVLELLREKTEGNLTDEEKRLFDDMLHQARMAYVDAGRHGATARMVSGDSASNS